jgi:hypothetical protein
VLSFQIESEYSEPGNRRTLTKHENGDVREEIWANGRYCHNWNNTEWKCTAGATQQWSSALDFWTRIVKETKEPRMVTWEGKQCRLYHSTNSWQREGVQYENRQEVCFDLNTYYPVYRVFAMTEVRGSERKMVNKEELRYYDFNSPIEIVLPSSAQ